jgi:hypothetical protein
MQPVNDDGMSAHWDVAGILTTLFMVFTVCYAITRPDPRLLRSLGTARGPAFLVTLFGLCTFFEPIVRTNPFVLGRTQWSGFNIMSQVYAGKLPLSPVAFDIAASYLLMLLVVVALCLPHARRALLAIGVIGIICSSWALEMGHELLFAWFTRSDGTLRTLSVSYAPAMYAVEIVLSVLLLISVSENGF